MSRPFSLALLVFVPALLVSSCGSDNRLPTTPSIPPTSVTETFSGVLARNGSLTHNFSATSAGTITAVLTTLVPQGSVVGLSLGTWNGQACQVVVANDNAAQGTSVIGTATTVGAFCVRVSDSTGMLTQSVEYEVAVTYFASS
jgi:hypothetical protein